MIRKRYRCPSCTTVFPYDHHPSVALDPVRFCPKCGFDQEMDPALVTPHIGRSIGKNTDDMYRQMEAGAEFRAQLGQEVHGMDSSEAANMKITDMRDNLREGDMAAVPVDNPLSRQIDASAGTLGFVNGGAIAQGLEQSVVQGHHKNAGLNAMLKLRQGHAMTAASRITAGTQNTGGAALASPGMTVDRPALETQAPQYRKRG